MDGNDSCINPVRILCGQIEFLYSIHNPIKHQKRKNVFDYKLNHSNQSWFTIQSKMQPERTCVCSSMMFLLSFDQINLHISLKERWMVPKYMRRWRQIFLLVLCFILVHQRKICSTLFRYPLYSRKLKFSKLLYYTM